MRVSNRIVPPSERRQRETHRDENSKGYSHALSFHVYPLPPRSEFVVSHPQPLPPLPIK